MDASFLLAVRYCDCQCLSNYPNIRINTRAEGIRYELIWDLIELANDTREVQLRSCSKKETNEEIKKETQRPKITKNFKLSNKRLAPGNHFAEWRKKREACQWCTWLANKKLLDIDCKTPYQSQL